MGEGHPIGVWGNVSQWMQGQQLVFGSLNGFFGGICLVAMWNHFLVQCMEYVGDSLTNLWRSLIIYNVDLGFNSNFIQFVIHVFVYPKHFVVFFALHGFHEDGICIPGVEDKDLLLSPGRCLRKLLHEVRVTPSLFMDRWFGHSMDWQLWVVQRANMLAVVWSGGLLAAWENSWGKLVW